MAEMFPIGGCLTEGRKLTILSNYPYRGLVDALVKQWLDAGMPKEFAPKSVVAKVVVCEL
jgi:hypothetical protein